MPEIRGKNVFRKEWPLWDNHYLKFFLYILKDKKEWPTGTAKSTWHLLFWQNQREEYSLPTSGYILGPSWGSVFSETLISLLRFLLPDTLPYPSMWLLESYFVINKPPSINLFPEYRLYSRTERNLFSPKDLAHTHTPHILRVESMPPGSLLASLSLVLFIKPRPLRDMLWCS